LRIQLSETEKCTSFYFGIQNSLSKARVVIGYDIVPVPVGQRKHCKIFDD